MGVGVRSITLNDAITSLCRVGDCIIRLEPGVAVLPKHAFDLFEQSELESAATVQWTRSMGGARFHQVLGFITIKGRRFDILYEPDRT